MIGSGQPHPLKQEPPHAKLSTFSLAGSFKCWATSSRNAGDFPRNPQLELVSQLLAGAVVVHRVAPRLRD
jgi:hypothetical protein